MNEERKMILQMVKDGEITVEEAEKLLSAIFDDSPDAAPAQPAESGRIFPKRILIRVIENGKTKVNVKIPFSLLRAALKLGKTAGLAGAIGAKHSHEEVSADILEALKTIDPDEILSSLSDGAISLPCILVDIDDESSDQQVSIILE